MDNKYLKPIYLCLQNPNNIWLGIKQKIIDIFWKFVNRNRIRLKQIRFLPSNSFLKIKDCQNIGKRS